MEVDIVSEEEEEGDLTFPGPGLIQTNAQFGTFVIASRDLAPGEPICEENPLMISPRLDWIYNPSNPMEPRICAGCYKKCGVGRDCTKCGWPVCDAICENAFIHSHYECSIFSAHSVKPGNLNFDYPALEALRCLLLHKHDLPKWAKLMRHESHVNARQQDAKTRESAQYVINFIQKTCGLLTEFDEVIIEHVLGIIAINSFCMMNDHQRHASLIFHSSSYVTHDCDPNMDVIFKFHPTDDSSYNQNYFSLKFFAARPISAGELLTHSYMFNWNPVLERQNYLANYWYFHCECYKCRVDFFHELLNLEEWDEWEDEYGAQESSSGGDTGTGTDNSEMADNTDSKSEEAEESGGQSLAQDSLSLDEVENVELEEEAEAAAEPEKFSQGCSLDEVENVELEEEAEAEPEKFSQGCSLDEVENIELEVETEATAEPEKFSQGCSLYEVENVELEEETEATAEPEKFSQGCSLDEVENVELEGEAEAEAGPEKFSQGSLDEVDEVEVEKEAEPAPEAEERMDSLDSDEIDWWA